MYKKDNLPWQIIMMKIQILTNLAWLYFVTTLALCPDVVQTTAVVELLRCKLALATMEKFPKTATLHKTKSPFGRIT